MDSSLRLLLLLGAVFLFINQVSCGLNMELYEKNDYVDFAGEFNLNGNEETKCVNLKNTITFRSIKTNKCVMTYALPDCKILTTRQPGIDIPYNQSYLRFEGNWNAIRTFTGYLALNSFHVCSQELGGGPQLDVDIYNKPLGNPEIEISFRGVCNCRNVPVSISRNHDMFIDMHGNEMAVYSKENCQGDEYEIGPDDNNANRNVYKYANFEVRSLKPIGLKNCYILRADIYRFHFSNGTEDINSLPTKKVKLGVNSVISNNASSEDKQTYTLESKVTETLEFSVAQSVKETESAGVEVSVQMTSEVGVPLIASAEISVGITGNYQWSKEHGSESSNKTTVSSEETIKIEQEMTIPGCSRCTISSVVLKVENFAIKYDLYAVLRAPDGEQPIPAGEVRDNLPAGMDYIKDHNANSVEAKTSGVMFGEFGLEIITSKDCAPISGCSSSFKPPPPSHTEYRFPIKRSH